MQSLPPDVNVTFNYWGPSFDADRNLCPPGHYEYEPEWVFQEEEDLLSNSQQLFAVAMSQLGDNNYSEAKATLQEVVGTYPDEEIAKNSLAELLILEPLADNDFNSLKTW
jgi:hypothetical protein